MPSSLQADCAELKNAGMKLEERDGDALEVVRVTAGGAADRVGVAVNDRVVRLSGRAVANKDKPTGDEGESVTAEMERNNLTAERERVRGELVDAFACVVGRSASWGAQRRCSWCRCC